MNWTIVAIAIAAIGTIWAIISGTNSNIEKRIQEQLGDKEFIKKVAEQVRLPFIIFDENENFLNNSGADNYIESIKVIKKDNGDIDEIIIICKKFLNSPPIVQSIDDNIYFRNPERYQQKDWKLKSFQLSYFITSDVRYEDKPPSRFKIEIIP